jgi:hypothetical protein
MCRESKGHRTCLDAASLFSAPTDESIYPSRKNVTLAFCPEGKPLQSHEGVQKGLQGVHRGTQQASEHTGHQERQQDQETVGLDSR